MGGLASYMLASVLAFPSWSLRSYSPGRSRNRGAIRDVAEAMLVLVVVAAAVIVWEVVRVVVRRIIRVISVVVLLR